MMKKTIFALLLFLVANGFSGELALPTLFADHMVLQREQPVPVWGTADAGSKITVEFAGQKKTTVADSSNHWKITLDPMPASSKPRNLQISSFEFQVSLTNVLIGDVWLCSGQSNMDFAMCKTENAAAAVAAANHPEIRLYKTPRLASQKPVEKIDSEWKVCTPETVAYFSGVAYYFGLKLHQDLDVPIGLISSSWGSTRIEPWTPPCGFDGIDSLADIRRTAENVPPMSGDYKKDRQVPTAAYNGMIAAHVPYAVRGAIWYQGEANRYDGMLYVDKTRALLNGWRTLWGYDFPFYFVQIAPYRYNKGGADRLPRLWEAQSEIVKTIPNTGMAVVSDAATLDDIHPPNKEVPGTRLALLAEANTYGMDVVSTGPGFQCLEKQGDQLVVKFSSADGLTTRDGKSPDWFEIAGTDGVYKKAAAEIKGSSAVLYSPEVPEPAAARFAWREDAVPNLVNGAGLPASAFRAQVPSPMQLLKKRLFKYSMDNPDPQKIRGFMDTLEPAGSWPDLDYQKQIKSGWPAGEHMKRVLPMAQAYTNPENELYHDPKLKKNVLAALDFWLKSGVENSKNFWWNGIGVPKDLGPTLLLLENELTPAQMERGLEIVDYEARYKMSHDGENVRYWYHGEATGQNKLWLIRVHLFSGVLKGDEEEVQNGFSSVAEEIVLRASTVEQYEEGVQADFSFHQHGPQLYSGGYGMAFAIDSAWFASLADGVSDAFSEEKMDIICGYLLDGQRWMTCNKMFDYWALGREITRQGVSTKGTHLLPACEYMAQLDTPRRDEFIDFAAQLIGEKAQTLRGYRQFWCSDFSVQRRENYYFSVKMNSVRTLGTECGNREGLKNYYAAEGSMLICRRGNEYADIFPVWDWTRIPGVTCEWTVEPPVLEKWGIRNGVGLAARGTAEFVGGVSDGMVGLTVMDYKKDALSGRKAWFSFENEMVCLGAGISGESTNPVITSVNQCLRKTDMVLPEGTLKTGERNLTGPTWVFHDGIGYVFPRSGKIKLRCEEQTGSWFEINEQYSKDKISKPVFSLWLDHGVSPVNQKYGYIIVPTDDSSILPDYVEKSGIEILSNTPQLQAVHSRSLKLTQVAFYEAGEIELPDGGFLRVDKPCLLMIRRNGTEVEISVANPENQPLTVCVETGLHLEGPNCLWLDDRKTSRINVTLPEGIYAGQSVVQRFTEK